MKAAAIILAESFSKLLIALVFIYLGLSAWAYLAIPFGVICAFIVALVFFSSLSTKNVEYTYAFPRRLLWATFLTAIGSVAFLSVDLLLVRHYLTPAESGIYSLLSLVGKMVYFLGSLLGIFILTFASRDTGLNKNSTRNFYKILAVNFCLLAGAYLFFELFGGWVVPVFFGEKSVGIFQYLGEYLTAIIFFTIATSFATYHLAKQQFIFAYNGVLATLLVILGVYFFHADIASIVGVVLLTSFYFLSSNMILHVFYKDVSEYVDAEDIQKIDEYKVSGAKRLGVSICIPAYNEAKNIRALLRGLLKQVTQLVDIRKIYVVSSASTDKTDEYVREFARRYPEKVALITEKKRRGKASAINTFLKNVDDEVVVVQSADTLPKNDTVEKLCLPFLVDGSIGMTGGAPVPVNDRNTFLGYVIHTWWWFHRNIPRFGELIAFRNVIEEVSPRTAVDEAYIQARFAQKGYKIIHVDEARVYNKGSENVHDIIKQRRRIFNGHTRLMQEENIHISHMTKSGVKLLLFDYKMYGPTQFLWLIGGIGIEIWASLLGRWDQWVHRRNPIAWDIASSTKDVSKAFRK